MADQPWTLAGSSSDLGQTPDSPSSANPTPSATPSSDSWTVIPSAAPAPPSIPAPTTLPDPSVQKTDDAGTGLFGGILQKARDFAQSGDEVGDKVDAGFKKGVNQTSLTVMKAIHAIPGIGTALDHTKFGVSENATEREANKPVEGIAGAAGYGMENILEFLAGDEAIKGMSIAQKMSKIAPVLKLLEKYPRIEEALHVGIRSGAVGGVQSAVHGADTGTAVKSGAETAAVTALTHGGASVVANIINKVRPVTRTIGKEVIPILASQEKNAAPIAASAATIGNEPAMMADQQAAGQRVIINTAQKAARDALERINKTRAPIVQAAVTDPARLLAVPADAQPYKFTIPTGSASEVVPPADSTGWSVTTPESSQYAGTTQVPNPNYSPLEGPSWATQERELGTTAGTIPDATRGIRNPAQIVRDTVGPTVPDRILTGPETISKATFDTTPESTQHFGPTAGSAPPAVVTGGGDLVVNDPAVAQLHLSRLEALRDGPDFASLPNDQQDAVNHAANSLSKQMADYHAYTPTQPNFKPVDASAAVANVQSFGEAADQVEHAVQPIYQKLDQASSGQFSALRNERKAMLKIIRNPPSPEALDSAQSRLQSADEGIDSLFEGSKGVVSPADLKNANRSWRDAKILDTVDDAVDRAFNHIPQNIADSTGLPREVRGKVLQQRLGAMLQKIPQDEVERVIGKDGLENLYRVADLLSTPSRSAVTYNAATSIAQALSKKAGGALLGAGIGAVLGHSVEGAATGAAVEQGARMVLHAAATHPEVGQMLDFAVRHKLSERVFAPMIAETIFNLNHQDQGETDAPEPAAYEPKK